jgi:hypothetical protein
MLRKQTQRVALSQPHESRLWRQKVFPASVTAGGGAMTERNWARQYRLSKQLWHYQLVRLDHDDAQALRDLAKRKGTTVAELIRAYVAWGLENDYGGADKD